LRYVRSFGLLSLERWRIILRGAFGLGYLSLRIYALIHIKIKSGLFHKSPGM
jgi:hypothetical protein